MRNEYKVTKRELMSWAKEYYLPGAANIILFIFWILVGLMGLSTLILFILAGSDWTYFFMSGLLLLVSVFKLFFSRFLVYSNRYKLCSKTYGVTEWVRSTEFADDAIIISDHTSVSRLRYENIKNIKEKNNVVMIFFNNNLALRLYKDAFVEGTWEECKEKIRSMIK